MAQRHLTSELGLAELHNRHAESEINERNAEHALSQEVHMFTQARSLIEDMRNPSTIEDQGCI